ncbi:MAG: tRNA pseudouridine(55) synthase TruB [Defluviitaleaceae bacterium]|nr:tRNA pseudouridine(55) synthase TruB [Defluviitaleaceae bacterium]
MNGFINICKEKGYTSHDVVAIIRKYTRQKTGHTGTLDPDATGVLPICVGRATKLADYVAAQDKTYAARIVLGITTDTGDISGKILSQRAVSVSQDELQAAALSFVGEYWQTPPMYSAVKVGGKKLYELARKGQEIERKPRLVKIYDLKITGDCLEITCSKGTYIRSLCMDIGEKLGCGAAMGSLNRIRSGGFAIESSYSLEEIKTRAAENRLDEIIIPPEQILPLRTMTIDPESLPRALNGNPVEIAKHYRTGEKFWLKDPDGCIIGLYSVKREGLLCVEVMF